MALKIIGAGLLRTGTTSLKVALEELGFCKCYHMEELVEHQAHLTFWEAAVRGEPVNWERLFEGYQATVDFPGAFFYQQLMRHYPDAKVLLSLRDPETWYESVTKTIYNRDIRQKVARMMFNSSSSQDQQHFLRVFRLRNMMIRDGFFQGRLEDKQYALDRFHQHNEEVKRIVPPERLLVYELNEGWEPLCRFVGVPVPQNTPFPHLNRREDFEQRVLENFGLSSTTRAWSDRKKETPRKRITSMINLSRGDTTSTPEQSNRDAQNILSFENEEVESSIPERFARVVRQVPDQPALMMGNRILSYTELDQVSSQVAHTIVDRLGEKSEPVALLFEHEVDAIVAILGVLKAGKCYVAMDSSFPRARMVEIIRDVQARLIVTNQQNYSSALELAQQGHQLLSIDQLVSHFSRKGLDLSISPDALAAVFYTSGTTGQPKGICQSHHQILHIARSRILSFGICPQDHLSLLFSYSFAASADNIFRTLLSGATLYLYHVQTTGVAQLSKWLFQEDISIFEPPAALFRQFLGMLTGTEHFPKLRFIFVGGQTLHTHDVERFQRYFKRESLLVHILASSETGPIAHMVIDQHTDISRGVVPVGYASEDKEILLLGEEGDGVSPGHIGEIVIRSRYLSPGYWNDPDLTRQKFLPDPEGGDKRIYFTGDLGRLRPDGCLEHLGRKDFQVKIRGYRVELAEIEAALYTLDSVKEAVVIAREDSSGETSLAAYLVPSSQHAPTIGELRRALAEKLPDYMLPSAWIVLDTLPLTPTGKVDRQALPEPKHIRPELDNAFVLPQNALELQVTKIWEQVLRIRPLGVRDNFFDLGGDSILALQLVAQIEQVTGLPLSINWFVQAPTIAQIAEILRQEGWTPPWSSLVPLQPGGSNPPFFCIPPLAATALRFVNLARHLGPDQPFYGLQPVGMDRDDVAPHTRVEDMATHYLKEIRQLQPEGPYYLGGQCFGGIVAFEMAQKLVAQGQQVALLAILDTKFPPGMVAAQPSPGVLARHYWQRGRRAWLEGEFWQLGSRKFKHWLRKYGKRKRLARMWQWVVSPVKGAMERLHPRDEAKIRHKQRIKRVQKAHATARWMYEPRVYPGKITFFWSRDTRRGLREEWARWSTEPLEIHVCPGRHNSMLQEPHIRILAEQLRTCIEQAHAVASNQAQTRSHRQRDAPSA